MRLSYIGPLTIKNFQKYFIENLPDTIGSQVYVPYVEFLLEQGHKMTICTTSAYIKKPFEVHSEQLSIYVAPISKYGKIRAFTKWNRSIRLMSNFLKKNPCDIYHAHWTYEFALAAIKTDRDKTLITIRDCPETIYAFFKDYYRKKRLQMALKVFEKGKYFTGNSPYILKEVKKYHPSLEAWVVPNLIKEETLEDIEKDKNKLISINNGFEDRKNVKTLLNAFAVVKNQFHELELDLYGADYGQGEIAEKWAEENNLSKGVNFKGKQDYSVVQTALNKASILIHPSLEESFGMTLVEAMVKGTLVIAGDKSGAVPWVLDYGKAGILCDVTSCEDIADMIKKAHTSEQERKILINGGYERVKYFSVENISEKFMNLYKEILRGDNNA